MGQIKFKKGSYTDLPSELEDGGLYFIKGSENFPNSGTIKLKDGNNIYEVSGQEKICGEEFNELTNRWLVPEQLAEYESEDPEYLPDYEEVLPELAPVTSVHYVGLSEGLDDSEIKEGDYYSITFNGIATQEEPLVEILALALKHTSGEEKATIEEFLSIGYRLYCLGNPKMALGLITDMFIDEIGNGKNYSACIMFADNEYQFTGTWFNIAIINPPSIEIKRTKGVVKINQIDPKFIPDKDVKWDQIKGYPYRPSFIDAPQSGCTGLISRPNESWFPAEAAIFEKDKPIIIPKKSAYIAGYLNLATDFDEEDLAQLAATTGEVTVLINNEEFTLKAYTYSVAGSNHPSFVFGHYFSDIIPQLPTDLGDDTADFGFIINEDEISFYGIWHGETFTYGNAPFPIEFTNWKAPYLTPYINPFSIQLEQEITENSSISFPPSANAVYKAIQSALYVNTEEVIP